MGFIRGESPELRETTASIMGRSMPALCHRGRHFFLCLSSEEVCPTHILDESPEQTTVMPCSQALPKCESSVLVSLGRQNTVPWTERLKQQKSGFHSCRDQRVHVKMLANLAPCERSLLGYVLTWHVISFLVCMKRERERSPASSLYKGTDFIIRAPPL